MHYLCIVKRSNTLATQDNKISVIKIQRKEMKMKRLFLSMLVMLSMTVTFAENENAASLNTTEAYDMTVNMKRLAQALSLSKDQLESVAEIHKTFSAEMLFAAHATSADERQKMMEKAVNKDLAYMNYVLSAEQYRKYVMLLNVTLYNRGLR